MKLEEDNVTLPKEVLYMPQTKGIKSSAKGPTTSKEPAQPAVSTPAPAPPEEKKGDNTKKGGGSI